MEIMDCNNLFLDILRKADDFADDIRRIQSGLDGIDFEDELVKVPVGRVKVRRPLKEDVEFE